MKGQLLKSLYPLVISFMCLGSLMTILIWYVYSNDVDPHIPPKKYDICKDCKEVIEKLMERYSQTWEKQDYNYLKFRSQLSSKCNGFEKAIITQANTPVGHKIMYAGEKRTLEVTPEIFSTFVKEHPFSNKTWDTCAVVGNGGILTDSGCGEMIDSAQFVIRCNLPPVENGYEKHVGVKTDLVTANPSILGKKYGSLMGCRRQFVEDLRIYGNSLLLLPAFSFGRDTPQCLRAAYTMEDFGKPMQPVFLNPEYLKSLAGFWRDQGLAEMRLSTGIIMASLALELCSNVHLYGFWPFSYHPHERYTLTNHYYDDLKADNSIHAMPAEFDLLSQLHRQGVLKLHLGDCRPRKKETLGQLTEK
uniref:alpha-2,8-sialyltransferase 8F-like n=1 Tax=Semicossyphus pulcher TaxID=241346 RepID=UPI0037E94316